MSKKKSKKEESESEESDSESSSSSSESSDDSSEETAKKKKSSKKASTTKKGKGKGTKRKKKDKNAPKRPLTAYMFYVKAKRKAEGEKNKDMSFAELSREMSRIWKEMNDDDKKPYTKQAEEDKQRYEKEMKNYSPPEDDSSDDDSDEKPKKKKQKKDPNAPKRPANPYMFYQAEVRDSVKKEHPELKMTDIAKKIGLKWKALNDSEKQPYVDKAADDKKRYEKELETYKKSK